MQKFYITGVAGTGKSSIIKELNKRGIKAFDIDMPKFCYWIDKNGKRAKYVNGVGKEWIENHEYLYDEEKIKMLIDNQNVDLFFVSGIADNQEEIFSWFDRIFILDCSRKVLLDRLKNRDTNNFAKEESEREWVLELQKSYANDLCKKGAVCINAGNDMQTVVNQILSYVK